MPRTWTTSPPDQRELRVLPTPSLWQWHSRPAHDGYTYSPGAIRPRTQPLTVDAWVEQTTQMLEFCTENNFYVEGWQDTEFADTPGPYAFYSYRIYVSDSTTARMGILQYLSPPKVDDVAIPSWRDADGKVVYCKACPSITSSRRETLKLADGEYLCSGHMSTCRYIRPDGTRCRQPHGRAFTRCADHDTRITCPQCQSQWSQDSGRTSCSSCAEYTCENCGTINRGDVLYRSALEMLLCGRCNTELSAIPNPRAERFDDDGDDIDPASLKIPTHPNRPVRFCSIEMEIAEGGSQIIQDLYREGLSSHRDIQGYHSGGRLRGEFCYMESDSSLGGTGGELILPFLKLDDDETLAKLHSTVRVVRERIKTGSAVMDYRCGLHIHVDAHKMGVPHVRNLAVLFNFLEDPLYRMSAARYMRHRGMNHAQKIGKEGMDTTRSFGVHFLQQNGHHHALNVGHYWTAMRNQCRCGAVLIGRHDQCECNLGKCTFEFRIYNGTTNFRKIHAYAAISQSMVGYARGSDDLSLNDFPVFEYETGRATGVSQDIKEKWEDRLEWMFRNLYFSDAERASILYVLKNCQLNELGEQRLLDLSRLPYTGQTEPHDAPDNADVNRPQVDPRLPNPNIPHDDIVYGDDFYDEDPY